MYMQIFQCILKNVVTTKNVKNVKKRTVDK